MLSLPLLFGSVLLAAAEPPAPAPLAAHSVHYLTTPEAIAAEPGIDYVELPDDGPGVLIKDGPVVHKKIFHVLLDYEAVVYLNTGMKQALPLAPAELAKLAADNPRRNKIVTDGYAKSPQLGGPNVDPWRWYLVVYKVEPVADGEWKVWVVPTAELNFGSGEDVIQTGTYRVPFEKDGAGAEVWRYRAGDGPGAGWALVTPAADGWLGGR